MATQRPTFIALPPDDTRATSAASSRYDLTSPRIQHYDGDVPPALSPLDAFAAHSRKLARELEETRKAGERRMSRLPPQHITQSLSEHQQNRPSIFRQLSSESDVVPPLPEKFKSSSGTNPQVSEPRARPQSSHPRYSGIIKPDDDEEPGRLTPIATSEARDYFGGRPSQSPTSIQRSERLAQDDTSDNALRLPVSPGNPDLTFTLAPPNAAFARKPYHESSDDEYTSSNAGSTFSQTRKLSSSSGVSVPPSPASPFFRSHERSSSNNSNGSISTSSHRKRTSHLNFSRPLSSSSLNQLYTGIDAPIRQPSQRSQRSIGSALPPLPTPSNSFDDTRSEVSEGFHNHSSHYTHRTFTLPRGRKSDRASALFIPISGPDFVWHEPMFPSTPPLDARPSADLRVPTDEIPRPSQATQRSGFSFEFSLDRPRPFVQEEKRPSSADGLPTLAKPVTKSFVARPSTATAAVSNFKTKIPPPPIPADPRDDIERSSRSDSTVRPTTSRSISNYQALSPDEHVTKAIDLHQHGDLKESTYHLRIAAKEDHPTGMLLYALACRHGWGMRANPAEGVNWLRKAVDCAMLEVADDETPDPNSARPQADVVEKKTHRAQFALAIYELGQCHLNGWGMDMDKALALRCFEIAGNWGDTDALSEAGFCYAEGIGCKKNLKKAAKFYRMAEQKGVSMVGNSW